ncbi:hypothetical protein MTO96_048346 [Rhipicephalus appendiculatus]
MCTTKPRLPRTDARFRRITSKPGRKDGRVTDPSKLLRSTPLMLLPTLCVPSTDANGDVKGSHGPPPLLLCTSDREQCTISSRRIVFMAGMIVYVHLHQTGVVRARCRPGGLPCDGPIISPFTQRCGQATLKACSKCCSGGRNKPQRTMSNTDGNGSTRNTEDRSYVNES